MLFCLGHRSRKTNKQNFFFRRFISTKKTLNLRHFNSKRFDGICKLYIVPPQWLFRLILSKSLRSFIKKWCIEGLLSSFIFKIMRISSFPIICWMTLSNLLLKKFIFKLEIPILSMLRFTIDLNTFFTLYIHRFSLIFISLLNTIIIAEKMYYHLSLKNIRRKCNKIIK